MERSEGLKGLKVPIIILLVLKIQDKMLTSIIKLCKLSSSISPMSSTSSKLFKSQNKKQSQERIALLKVLLITSLVLAGGLSGGLSYYFISKTQLEKSQEQFYSMVTDHFQTIQELLHVELHLNLQFAVIMSLHCPNLSDWPNCAMSSKELKARTRSLLAISEISEFGIAPIVYPDRRIEFERFATNYYRTDGGYNQSNLVNFGAEGIFNPSDNSSLIRSPNHTTFKHDFLVPVLFSTDIARSGLLLANVYSIPEIAADIDSTIDCISSQNDTFDGIIEYHCSDVIDYPFPSDTFSSVVLTPVVLEEKVVVGFVGGIFSWKSVLKATLYQEVSFQFSIINSKTLKGQYYRVSSGQVTEIPFIDTDAYAKEHLKQSFTLHDDAALSSYSITYYSSGNAPSQFRAIIACISCLGMILVVSLIFIFYMILVNREALEASMLLESKRTYVRFISHEIRSVYFFTIL